MTDQETTQWLFTRDQFLILTHIRPDGDTIGCAAALCLGLRSLGKTAYVLENVEATSLFTPYLEGLMPPTDYTPETVVAVDIAAASLIPENAASYLRRGIDLTIDHHPSQEFFARETCLDPSRAACGEIIYRILVQLGPISKAVALPLYVAVSTDTGCFVYGNTTAHTHEVACALMKTGISIQAVNKRHFRAKSLKRLRLESQLVEGMELLEEGKTVIMSLSLPMLASVGATEEDIDDISAFAGQLEGVMVAVTLRELEPDVWKLSLRTDPADLTASGTCALLGGGGHAAAAGATMEGSLSQVKAAVLSAIDVIRRGG